ncbi:molybdenum ABC transporter ATP-binding protein [Permianibacter aggregans]|uniref:Molybdate transport system ATP-binding protein n=1 Tax=Permianibacter aggregans TaxID=1510150 RepID=A0A4R6UV56_9GAMM|nr:molybdenum ABC transporter ATP-binding protein [Permianibacter aggregans]QGX39445.1 molybdenum ABC transporter ATP-binding protein [Permianibacter aggregans]TDQ49819.1 molybdate transport system ATP-binding protein [Permianibacter aggregans]
MTESKTINAQFQLHFGSADSDAFSLDVDLQIPGQGITAIFGASGSGKTTLLRCIAGLEKAQQGALSINGETWQSHNVFVPTYQRSLGYVFQESSLFPHLSAKANLQYAIKRAANPPSAETYQRIVTMLGIEPVLNRRPAQLSGGERQRVAIARALLVQPKLLLMDEPLASLDYKRKQEILPYLERLHESLDIPVLYVSHSIEEVTRLADHAVILEQGRVIAEGAVAEVFSRIDLPTQTETDVGVILQGHIRERDPQWHLARVEFDGGSLWVRDGGDELNKPVRVRVLAKDVSLALENHEDTSILNRLPVIVEEIVCDIDEATSLVRVRTNETCLLARVTLRSVAHMQLIQDKAVWAQIKSAAIVC